jgi:hypothetical protein
MLSILKSANITFFISRPREFIGICNRCWDFLLLKLYAPKPDSLPNDPRDTAHLPLVSDPAEALEPQRPHQI